MTLPERLGLHARYPAKAVDGRGHAEALSAALAAFGAAAWKGIDQANELGDLDTADLFTEVSPASTSGCGSLNPRRPALPFADRS